MISEEKSQKAGKTILIVSPQRWGGMLVSKHHYAIELARMGHQVYFLNPPSIGTGSALELKTHDAFENLILVSYRLCFPYRLRFHQRWLYDRLMRWQIRRVLKHIGVSFDIAWCFDSNLFSSLKIFGAKKVIYHLADQVMSLAGIKAAATADLVLSVDQELLAKLRDVDVPKQVVGHGLAEAFALQAQNRLGSLSLEEDGCQHPQVGYVGNLLISSLDRATLRRLIEAHKEATFHFWGAYNAHDSNIGACTSADVSAFIDFLQKSPNVVLHGVTATERLAEEMQSMHIFLLCYDVRSDINEGCNSHKILEYLSTGKIVVSNKMSAYIGNDELIKMSNFPDNSDYDELFTEVINNLEVCNGVKLFNQRVNYSLKNSYMCKIDKIFQYLYETGN